MHDRPPFLSLPRLFAVSVALFVAGSAAGAGSHRYEVTWQEKSQSYAYDGTLAEGEDRTLKFDVRQANVTRVEFVLHWTETGDQVGLSRPDRFLLEAERPDGTPLDGSPAIGAEGYLRLSVSRLNEMPPPRSLETGGIPELSRSLAADVGDQGQGVWKIRVALRDVGNPQGANVDSGNDYALQVTLTWYEPVVMRVVNLSPPQDLTVASAVSSAPPLWLWTTGILGALSLTLGGLLVVDGVRRRRRARKGRE